MFGSEILDVFIGLFLIYWVFSIMASSVTELIAASLKQRTERRRGVLTVLVKRLARGRAPDGLVDVLFTLTSFETFEALSVRQRSAAAVEALIWQLVEDSVRSYT